MTSFRTDRNNNPTAFTVDIAEQAGLKYGVDYEQGDPFFDGGRQLFTAKLIGDPIKITIRVINKIGFFTKSHNPRWVYIEALVKYMWDGLSFDERKFLIGEMYKHEGGEALKKYFVGVVGHIEVSASDKLHIGDKLG